jgi:glycosyltransferase involved in cell wall biosynthesis
VALMGKAPLVSILMPTYNYAKFIAHSIESALGQELEDLELIISDNASTDDTQAVVAPYLADPRVKYSRNVENIGMTPNYNRCYELMHPESQYVIILPADDWWEPSLLRRLVSIAEADPELTFVHCGGYKVDPEGRLLFEYMNLFAYQPPAGKHRALKELYRNNYIFAQTALQRRSLFERYKPYPNLYRLGFNYAPDYMLWVDIMNRGAIGYYLPEKLAYFREHPQSHTIDKNIIPRLREEMRIFEVAAESCPSELEAERIANLRSRMLALAQRLLRAEEEEEAKQLLRKAAELDAHPSLGIRIASFIANLPLSHGTRSRLWELAENLAFRTRRSHA